MKKSQKNNTVLLVEDEATSIIIMNKLLESYGYNVVNAQSGEDAVRMALDNPDIAIILMDIELGTGIDGAEAARRILDKRDVPVIFLSSHTEKEYVKRIKGIPGYGYVLKRSASLVLDSNIDMALNLFRTKFP